MDDHLLFHLQFDNHIRRADKKMKVTLDSKPHLLTERQLQHYFKICIKDRKRFIREVNRKRKNTDVEQRIIESKRYIDLLDSYQRRVREIVNRNLKNRQMLYSYSMVRISNSDSVEIKNLYAKIQQVEKLLCSRFGVETRVLYDKLKLCERVIKPLRF